MQRVEFDFRPTIDINQTTIFLCDQGPKMKFITNAQETSYISRSLLIQNVSPNLGLLNSVTQQYHINHQYNFMKDSLNRKKLDKTIGTPATG
jgi:hypothetical protein